MKNVKNFKEYIKEYYDSPDTPKLSKSEIEDIARKSKFSGNKYNRDLTGGKDDLYDTITKEKTSKLYSFEKHIESKIPSIKKYNRFDRFEKNDFIRLEYNKKVYDGRIELNSTFKIFGEKDYFVVLDFDIISKIDIVSDEFKINHSDIADSLESYIKAAKIVNSDIKNNKSALKYLETMFNDLKDGSMILDTDYFSNRLCIMKKILHESLDMLLEQININIGLFDIYTKGRYDLSILD